MPKMTKHTMNEQVYSSLRDDILKGYYSSGQQLLQKDLAEKYNVSRIPVREALMQLSRDGLVTIIPYKGAVVSSFSVDELHEIFEIRFALESLILRYVVKNITEEDAKRVHEVLIKSSSIPESERTRNMNWDFHQALYEVAKKPRMLELIKTQYDKVDRYIRIDITQPNVQENAFKAHEAILQACLLKNTVEATVLLHEHMMSAMRRIDKFLCSKLGKPEDRSTYTLFPLMTEGISSK